MEIRRSKILKRKAFYASLLFLMLLIINNLHNVSALGYSTGVKQNQKLVWKCNVCNELEMNAIFGSLWDDFGHFKNLSRGKKMKWERGKYFVFNDFSYHEVIHNGDKNRVVLIFDLFHPELK